MVKAGPAVTDVAVAQAVVFVCDKQKSRGSPSLYYLPDNVALPPIPTSRTTHPPHTRISSSFHIQHDRQDRNWSVHQKRTPTKHGI
jgi:hypothetical protein